MEVVCEVKDSLKACRVECGTIGGAKQVGRLRC